MENGNEPAYPQQRFNEAQMMFEVTGGLTKREYFAAMAMQGICANPTADIPAHGHAIAIVAVECADELLKALETNQTKGESL